MKRINPLLTPNNPAPIPGCHTLEGCCAQHCDTPELVKLLTESPCVMTTEVLDIRQLVQSPAKVGEAIDNQNKLRPRPGQSS
jgi:hypothetical protein